MCSHVPVLPLSVRLSQAEEEHRNLNLKIRCVELTFFTMSHRHLDIFILSTLSYVTVLEGALVYV